MVQLSKTTLLGGLLATQLLGFDVNAQQEIPPIIYQPETDSPILERNVSGPDGLKEFDFVIGDWDVTITWQSHNAEPLTYNAKWHNHWVINGLVVMQEWRGPFLTGAELRAFDANTGKWTGQNIYPGGRSPWHRTTAEFRDGQMMVTIEDGRDQRGTFLNRETYFDISENSFRMKSERSYDDGATWEKGAYEMICHRADP